MMCMSSPYVNRQGLWSQPICPNPDPPTLAGSLTLGKLCSWLCLSLPYLWKEEKGNRGGPGRGAPLFSFSS